MKKVMCFLVIFGIGYSLFAFDRSLNGSWGLNDGTDKVEFIGFNTNEIRLMNQLYRAGDYQEIDDTIYIDDDGEIIIIQYHRLSTNRLLFILFNADDPAESITLILSKF